MALKMAYETWGEGPHPLLLLHGFTGNRSAFDHLRPLMGDKVRAISVDLPGHGQTPLPTRTGRDGFLETIDALFQVLDEVGVARASLLGYSQGARFALAAAMTRPERFERLIMESGSPGLHRRQHRTERRVSDAQLAAHIRQKGVASFVAYWESLPLFAGLRKLPVEQQEAIRARRNECTAEGLIGALECLGLAVQPDYWPELQRQRLPTLLLTGVLDNKFTQIARRMAAELPVVWRRSFEECTHAPHLEVPEEYAREVISFLQTPWYEAPQFENPASDKSSAGGHG
ncbi:2-succinyl-6-hydroxy-2,4-cyclohexadiene-1-carboxylate synthase [Vitiosangium sp. GDMCC 1.1324]|uniref:2-succinyl-6-hydroxy-2, 4-cyclohexadiene-1-carboxylate synthase n=1 Tax=Vitiosangium sp. (strain GDMCC 1.1324) TaxID=2138576 RepID=UPI000D38240F|nr:2-succinyl-6-hydroxy-2,4-cyclohexadiene-1-carboxylate synthase [Vitiosangium sp. GDMCC 1.1324]PTL80775.1 2-succinyl-6-hydroxy-2,4-cyclohexadiene-1-carboxylate synthase [Vitiosangium sp. GDMCC 1.1324]